MVAYWFAGEGYDGVLPEISGAESHELTATFGSKVGEQVKVYVEAMEKVRRTETVELRRRSYRCFGWAVS